MHPALSIIVFSTFSGAGYGLGAVLGLGLLYDAPAVSLAGYLLAFALITGGLLSSTAHLGHPERAWRALSQWCTSWLSREGVLAITTFVPLTVAAYSSIFAGGRWPVAGLAAAALCAATVFSTSMIYASLRTVATWHTPMTPFIFMAFAAAGGLVAATCIAVVTQTGPELLFPLAAAALLVAWTARAIAWFNAARDPGATTIASATGLGALGDIRLLERPHTNENYLTREMGFRIARKHARWLRIIAVFLGGVAPAIGMFMAMFMTSAVAPAVGALLAVLSLASHLVGVLVERWLFFATARHTVSLYYGEAAV